MTSSGKVSTTFEAYDETKIYSFLRGMELFGRIGRFPFRQKVNFDAILKSFCLKQSSFLFLWKELHRLG